MKTFEEYIFKDDYDKEEIEEKKEALSNFLKVPISSIKETNALEFGLSHCEFSINRKNYIVLDNNEAIEYATHLEVENSDEDPDEIYDRISAIENLNELSSIIGAETVETDNMWKWDYFILLMRE